MPFPSLSPALFRELIELACSGSEAECSPELLRGLQEYNLVGGGGGAAGPGAGSGRSASSGGGASGSAAKAEAAVEEGGDDPGEEAYADLGAVMEAMDLQLRELQGEGEGEQACSILECTAMSVRAQGGESGPASNLLHSLGVAVPKEWWRGGSL